MNQFLIKPKVQFGANALDFISQMSAHHAFIVTDKAMVKFGLADEVTRRLTQSGITFSIYDDVVPDPDISAIVNGMKIMDRQYPDVVIALGGGSVIDAAKSVIYSLWHTKKDPNRVKPQFIAIPTTSGTGSEVTSFSVIKSQSEKLVLVDEFMLPDVAILDPALVKSVPASITADTGMDVLCHALEAYVSRTASDFSDALAEKAVQLVFGHLIDCYREGSNLVAREKMHNASCIAGMAFTNASLGITHSLAHALGGVFHIPHGRANALLMAQVVAFNADLEGRCDTEAAKRYANLAKNLDLPASSIREGVESLMVAINVLKDEMNLPKGIQATGINEFDFNARLGEMVGQALRDSCTPTNPRDVSKVQLEALYRQSF
ncbi:MULTISPECIES: 1-propanol dehydrogenase PduQ [Providencia]|uniref:1-propanol dehydrogenase PduQ n=1 Tax=Providencia TaxID=586 RepID=UPI001B3595A8|nr:MULTISPECIES: 1-propanol dehydrogenase PduQ [Providencia]EJD6080219.1 iron-containing alcohol dehydrogenase [Providencia rettgeri]EJD6600643.1 iron-containing alcohol dehydrogenase [Providencia rettgeri]MBQ0329140.1 iron-containing alcohol dehydrogenase [Providencia rettgeri]WOC03728.1 iron-containing alcohol dehydrogenase [Providencia sp. PROV024]